MSGIIEKTKCVLLHKIRYVKLFEAIVKGTKIHVQIMRLTCCLNMGFDLKILKMSPNSFV